MPPTLTEAARGDVEVVLDELGDHYVSDPVTLQDGSAVVFRSSQLVPERIAALNPTLPDFVTASEVVVEPESFKQYITGFKSSTAICLASLGKNQIVAVLDYHGNARIGERDTALPQRLAHKVTLTCPFDLDYAKWKAVFGEPLSQNDFGNVLEDLVHTIANPPLSDLQDAIDSLRIDRVVRFQSRVNRRNGNIELTYDEVDSEGSGAADDGGHGSVRLIEAAGRRHRLS